MHSFLRQSTASQSRLVGPFVDDTDFKTLETALTIANTDVKISKNGGTAVNKNAGGGTHIANGMYALTFDATDTDTVGELALSISVAGALVVPAKFTVLEEAIYDALFAASAAGFDANQRVSVSAMPGLLQTTTIATLASQTSFTLTAGSADNDAYVGALAVVTDSATATQKAVGLISAYTGATKTVTLAADPGIFVMAVGDTIDIIAVSKALPAALADGAGGLIVSDAGGLDADAMRADIDDIQTRLPAALVGGRIDANTSAIDGDATSAARLKQGAKGVLDVVIGTGSSTTAIKLSTVNGAAPSAVDDFYNGAVIVFLTGSLAGQRTDITDYVGSTTTATVTALTGSPALNDTAVIV